MAHPLFAPLKAAYVRNFGVGIPPGPPRSVGLRGTFLGAAPDPARGPSSILGHQLFVRHAAGSEVFRQQ